MPSPLLTVEGAGLSRLAASRTVVRGSLAGYTLEAAVEMRKRDEPGVKGDLADAAMRVAKKALGVLDAQAREVVREAQACVFFELFTEIKSADMQVPGDILKGDRFSKVVGHVLLGSGDVGRLSLMAP